MAILTRNEEIRALVALRSAIGLKAMGCTFDRGLAGGICIIFRGRASGAWWHEDGCFHFAQMAYRTPERTASSIEEVVASTATIIAPADQPLND